jgi:hypothetical protein
MAKITFYSGHLPALFHRFRYSYGSFSSITKAPGPGNHGLATDLTSAFSQPICPDRFSSDDYRVSMRKAPHAEGRNVVISPERH